VRIVLDTTILVRATENSHGPARDLLLNIIASKQDLLLSDEMLYELARVLRNPRLQAFYKLYEARVYDFIGFLREVAEIVPLNIVLNMPIRDINDMIVLQTAVLGEANILCTRDEDFYDPVTIDFLNKTGIIVMDDISLIKRLRS
jgi:putative PIN family toxin of toxin-antitoxin system